MTYPIQEFLLDVLFWGLSFLTNGQLINECVWQKSIINECRNNFLSEAGTPAQIPSHLPSFSKTMKGVQRKYRRVFLSLLIIIMSLSFLHCMNWMLFNITQLNCTKIVKDTVCYISTTRFPINNKVLRKQECFSALCRS